MATLAAIHDTFISNLATAGYEPINFSDLKRQGIDSLQSRMEAAGQIDDILANENGNISGKILDVRVSIDARPDDVIALERTKNGKVHQMLFLYGEFLSKSSIGKPDVKFTGHQMININWVLENRLRETDFRLTDMLASQAVWDGEDKNGNLIKKKGIQLLK